MIEPRGRPLRWAVWGATAAALLAPLVAMQVTDEVSWGAGDFVLAAALLGGVGLGFERVLASTADWAYRAAAGLALGTALILVWANLAVGVVGAEDDPLNLMFWAVLAVCAAAVGAARFQPRAMALAMAATALAQALAAATALGLGRPALGAFLFAGPWLASAWLFRIAGARGPRG